MKRTNKLALVAVAALGLLATTASRAESTYGYNTAGGGPVTATARINLSVVVPRVVVLRVGSPSGTVDTLNWAIRVSIPTTTVPVTVNGLTPAATGTTAVDWTGAAPTLLLAGTAPTTNASAWTNGTAVTVNCATTTQFALGGPSTANITANATAGNFSHPTGDLTSCNAFPLVRNTLYTATWEYTLDTSGAGTWTPGAYSAVVTYTATGT